MAMFVDQEIRSPRAIQPVFPHFSQIYIDNCPYVESGFAHLRSKLGEVAEVIGPQDCRVDCKSSSLQDCLITEHRNLE